MQKKQNKLDVENALGKTPRQAIESLRKWAVNNTGCAVQDGWPCGTCFCSLLSDMGVKENKQHNRPIDRVNEVWRAVLQIRGD